MSSKSIAPGAKRWTWSAAIARSGEVLRTEGIRSLVARAAGEIAYRRLVLLERDVTIPSSDERPPADASFGFLEPADLDVYERLRPGGRAQAERRFADGARCFGTWLGEELVACRWIASGSPYIEYLDTALPLRAGEVYHYDSYTASEHRRRGLSTVSQKRLAEQLRREGVERIIRAVLPENRAALGDAAKSGFVVSGRIAVIGRRPLRRVLVQRS